MYLMEIKDG